MKKLILSLTFILYAVLLSSSFAVSASADDGFNADEATTITFDQFAEAFERETGVDVSGFNYYMCRGPVLDYNIDCYRDYSVAFCVPDPENAVYIMNDNYYVNLRANDFKISCTPDLNATVTCVNFRYGVWKDGSREVWANWFYFTQANSYPDKVFHFDQEPFYESNMDVYIGDDNLNEKLCTMDIFYTSDNNQITYEVTNHSDTYTLGFFCGIDNYQNFGAIDVIPDDTSYYLLDASVFVQWCTANDIDYKQQVAYINVYRGIDPVGSMKVTLGEIIDGNDFYDEKKPYDPLPSPADYLDDPPDFPDLPDTPDLPDFDPEHPIDSIWNIICWIGEYIKVHILYIGDLLKWIIDCIIYFVRGFSTWLWDLLKVLLHNLLTALWNLVVDFKGLLMKLFVPRAVILDGIMARHFPIVNKLQNIFTDISISGNNFIPITLLGTTFNISPVQYIGSYGCSVISVITTAGYIAVCIGAMCKALYSACGLVTD